MVRFIWRSLSPFCSTSASVIVLGPIKDTMLTWRSFGPFCSTSVSMVVLGFATPYLALIWTILFYFNQYYCCRTHEDIKVLLI